MLAGGDEPAPSATPSTQGVAVQESAKPPAPFNEPGAQAASVIQGTHAAWGETKSPVPGVRRIPAALVAGLILVPVLGASAWWALAQRAERESNQPGAERYYLQALEHCPSDPSVADLQKTIWQAVRDKLGKTISREQYVASLNTWAARVNDQALLKSIAFELGKLQLLDKLPGKAEVRP